MLSTSLPCMPTFLMQSRRQWSPWRRLHAGRAAYRALRGRLRQGHQAIDLGHNVVGEPADVSAESRVAARGDRAADGDRRSRPEGPRKVQPRPWPPTLGPLHSHRHDGNAGGEGQAGHAGSPRLEADSVSYPSLREDPHQFSGERADRGLKAGPVVQAPMDGNQPDPRRKNPTSGQAKTRHRSRSGRIGISPWWPGRWRTDPPRSRGSRRGWPFRYTGCARFPPGATRT